MAKRIAIFCWPADSQHRNASDAALAYLLRADEAGEAIDLCEPAPGGEDDYREAYIVPVTREQLRAWRPDHNGICALDTVGEQQAAVALWAVRERRLYPE